MAVRSEIRQVTLLPPGVWDVDPARSKVGFEVRHLKIARVRGRFDRVEAEIACDEAGLATVSAEVQVASIDTGDRRRDERLRDEDFFDVARHPILAFSGRCPPVQAGRALVARGEMSMHGLTRPVELTARPEWTNGSGEVRIRAAGSVSRREFGLEWDSAFAAGGLVIDDRIDLRLDVTLVRRSA